MAYNRKTLYLASGNDTLKLALETNQTTLKFENSLGNTQDALPFLIEGPGQTIVKGHSLKLTESLGKNKVEVGVNDVKATVSTATGNNILTLDSTGLILQDAVWTTGENLGSFARTTSTSAANISNEVNTNKVTIGNISASVHENKADWQTYKGSLNLANWTAAEISGLFQTANTNHTTLSDHVDSYLTVPGSQTLSAYVESKVTEQTTRIDTILANAPESINTLNELKIALESKDYSLVDVQISIVKKLNALADVMAHLTSVDPATEFASSPPLWYASITEPDPDSADQPQVSGSTDNEQGTLVE
jgi:hypothetical protein